MIAIRLLLIVLILGMPENVIASQVSKTYIVKGNVEAKKLWPDVIYAAVGCNAHVAEYEGAINKTFFSKKMKVRQGKVKSKYVVKIDVTGILAHPERVKVHHITCRIFLRAAVDCLHGNCFSLPTMPNEPGYEELPVWLKARPGSHITSRYILNERKALSREE